MHADRLNRVALAVFGLLLLLVGAAALAMNMGAFGAAYARHALFDNFISHYVGEHGAWLWPVAAVVALIITLLALRWILALLVSTDRTNVINIPGERRRDGTELRSSALTSAVSDEIASYRGVDSARARTIGDAAAARLVVEVTVRRDIDIAELRDRIESEALAHARQALDRPELPIRLDIAVSNKTVR